MEQIYSPITNQLSPHQQYTAQFDTISKIYNIYCWTHIKHSIQYINTKPTLKETFVGDIIDTAKTEEEVWKKLLHYRTTSQKLT